MRDQNEIFKDHHGLVQAQNELAQAQVKALEDVSAEVAYQGKTLSMFTALNVLFLPLGFLSQVSLHVTDFSDA